MHLGRPARMLSSVEPAGRLLVRDFADW